MVHPIAEEVRSTLAHACERIEIAGSVRRLRPECGDIELVAIPRITRTLEEGPPDLFGQRTRGAVIVRNALWDALDEILRPEHYIRKGNLYRAFLWPVAQGERDEIQVDLFTADFQNWGLIHLIRTGSAKFSERVVSELAKAGRPSFKGYARNADGIKPYGSSHLGVPWWPEEKKAEMPKIETPDEETVFRLAGMTPVPPAERNL